MNNEITFNEPTISGQNLSVDTPQGPHSALELVDVKNVKNDADKVKKTETISTKPYMFLFSSSS
jgi:hypothetical protein